MEKDRGWRCGECDSGTESLIQGVTKWDEIDEKEYGKLSQAVNNANGNQKSSNYYVIIQQVEDVAEIFNTAAEFIEDQNKQIVAYQKREKERREKAAATKILRKQKQLEKLKKELELQEKNN